MSKELEERESFVDFIGQTVRVGDTIVYPARQSSSLWLDKATVEKISVYKDHYYDSDQFTDVLQIKLSKKRTLILLSEIDRVVKIDLKEIE